MSVSHHLNVNCDFCSKSTVGKGSVDLTSKYQNLTMGAYWEFGIDMCTQLYLKGITDKDLLY